MRPKRSSPRDEPLPGVLRVDFAVAMAILLLGLLGLSNYVVRAILPAAEEMHNRSDQLRRDVDQLRLLNEPPVYDPRTLERAAVRVGTVRTGSDDPVQRVLYAAEALGTLVSLEDARHVIWGQRLGDIDRANLDFWRARFAELCGDRSGLEPPRPPPDNAAPSEYVRHLQMLSTHGMRVWKRYQACQEPLTVVIGEDLLHFRTDKADAFEGDPEPGFNKIAKHVMDNVKTHKRIHVIGHTDERGSFEHNDELSYRRAYYVAQKIRADLRRAGLQEPRDFQLFPVALGKYQRPPRAPAETEEEYWKRCRRIELLFRSDVGDLRAAAGRR